VQLHINMKNTTLISAHFMFILLDFIKNNTDNKNKGKNYLLTNECFRAIKKSTHQICSSLAAEHDLIH